MPAPDRIMVPVGSGGTLAGLTLGVAMTELDADVVGVRVVEKLVTNRCSVSVLASRTARLLRGEGLDAPWTRPGDLRILADYLGGGYGEPTPAGERAEAVASEHGLELDPTYTAKAVAAIADRADGWRDDTVLYWHTLDGREPPRLAREEAAARLPEEYRSFLDGDEHGG